MILAAALLAGAPAPAVRAVPLAERVADVSTRFCVDLLSGAVPVPSVGAEEDRVLARYGLITGVPQAAMDALGTSGLSLISRARLASGDAADGAFIVALGGAAGATCRVIVYRASSAGLLTQRTSEIMKAAAHGWRALPNPIQSPVAIRLSLFKRDGSAHPFVANLVSPVTPGPVVMIANIAAVPPQVIIPQGY